MRRPLWFGAGFVAGVGATLWTERSVRRRVRRAVEALSPSVAPSEMLRSARRTGARLRGAFDAGRAQYQRPDLAGRDEHAARRGVAERGQRLRRSVRARSTGARADHAPHPLRQERR